MMHNKVNVSQVAKELGVSVSTVSRAISGNGRISQSTKQRVQEYLESKELVPNIREKHYTDVTTRMIAVVLSGEENFASMPYFLNIFLSVYDYFAIRGYQVCLIKITPSDISNLVKAVENHVMDGVILSRTVENNDEIVYLKKMGVPFVVIGPYNDQSVLRVDTDNENACCELINAILHKNLNHIAVMCAERKHKINRIRFNGIMKAHVENHMVLDRDFVFYNTDLPNVAEMAIEKTMAAHMDCIICMDDNLCMGILRMLRKKGIDVPGDIKVASLHNSTLLDEWYPPISCISFDVDELGREASRLLYVYLTEGKRLPLSILGYEIKMKDSTI